MLGRTLSLAAVTLLIGLFPALPVRAQNLEAGKTPSQIFNGTCAACHKAPRGLLISVQPGSLPGFLRQHYTTSSEMASLLSAYLMSNGATDRRYVGAQGKPGDDLKPVANPSAAALQVDRFGRPLRASSPTLEASRPDADGASPGGRQGRNAKRLGDPKTAVPAAEGQTPAQAGSERGPNGQKLSARQRLGHRGTPAADELPKTGPKDEASKGDTPREGAPDSSTPGESKSAAVGPETATGIGSTAPLRSDPVPAVTPAPASSDVQLPPVQSIDLSPSISMAPTATASSSFAEPRVSRPSVPPPVPRASEFQESPTLTEPPSPPISQ